MDGEDRRTADAVGNPHPERGSPPAQAALRDARDRRAGLRGGGVEGEARAEDPEEGTGVGGRWPLNQPPRTRTPLFNSRNFASPASPSHAAVSSEAAMTVSDVGREGVRLGSRLTGVAISVPVVAGFVLLGATVLVGRRSST